MTDWNTMNVWGSEVLPSAELNSNFENVSFLLTQALMDTCQARLTLETGVPISTTDQSAKTTLYWTPMSGRGALVGLYDDSDSMWGLYLLTEKSLSLAGYTADKNYDIWGYLSGGVPALDSTVWTDNTTRATALTLNGGIWTKSGDATRRYLGTIRINASGGQTEDTLAQRYVWNMNQQVERSLYCKDTTDSWAYSTAAWRAANANYNYGVGRVGLVIGINDKLVNMHNQATVSNGDASTAYTPVGVGLDSAVVNSAQIYNGMCGPYGGLSKGMYTGYPGIGFHYYQRLEWATSSATVTWRGDNAGLQLSGMLGKVMM